MAFTSDIAMATRLALRDMRGGARRLWLLVVGVFIGTAAVAAVGATAQSLLDGARQGALESIGGDLSLRLYHRPPRTDELAVIRRAGTTSLTTELRPMARAHDANASTAPSALIELKGVDRRYPLYGAVKTTPASDLHQLLDRQQGVYGAVADPMLFEALGLQVGDWLRIGNSPYQVRGVLTAEPDRAFRAFTLGPRVIVSNDSLPATGLIDEGAEVYFYTRVKLPDTPNRSRDAAVAMARIDHAFPKSGWRMVNAHDGVPGVERTLGLAHVLLLYIGLGVMLIGGAGISGAVRAHVAEKMVVIATLKSIGATPRVVALTIGMEVMTAAALGALFGVAVGAFSPALAGAVLANDLPFGLDAIPAAKPLVGAGLFGLLVAALFAWWPLMRVHDISGHVLLRERVTHPPGTIKVKGWIGAAAIILGLVTLVMWVSSAPVASVAFLVAALALAAFYFALGLGLSRLAKILARGKRANVRLALGNLHRAGAPTGPLVTALGLSLTVLVALDGISDAAQRHVHQALPHSAPDLVAFSIKPNTATHLDAALVGSAAVDHHRVMPFLHARLQAINSTPVRDLNLPSKMNWVVRGDRGVSFASTLPGGGGWKDGQGDQPGFSLARDVAKALGLDLGDTITLNVGGHVRTGPVLNVRTVDWAGLDLDFPIIATPATFEGIPYTLAASIKAAPGKHGAVETLVKDRFPDLPLIRVADVLQSLSRALTAIVTGLKAAAWACGLAALVVLAGGVFQGLRERTNEAVLFKVLGARRRQLLGQLTLEFLGLSVLVVLTAVPLGLSIAYGISRAAGLGTVNLSVSGSLALAGVATLVTLSVGFLSTLSAYTTQPAALLRNREL